MLQVEGIGLSYGGSIALRQVSIHVGAGQFVALIGPNGAGKTSLFKAISGVLPITTGSISLDNTDLSAQPAWRRPHFGIAHVPEGRQVFRHLTVAENLQLGLEARRDRTSGGSLDQAYEMFPVLAERRTQLAGTLSGGEQQMLAIGRGLMSRPRLLMLDEPSMGLAPRVVEEIFAAIGRLHKDGVAVLIVEQRAAEALAACDYGYVLSMGSIVAHGLAKDLTANDDIRRAYLGA